MQFQLNTDANIEGDDRLAEVAEQTVALGARTSDGPAVADRGAPGGCERRQGRHR